MISVQCLTLYLRENVPHIVHDSANTDLSDLSLVTYIDAITPVPHYNGQILATGLLHILSLDLTSDGHILSAYPLSSIPGLAAHFYPWLLSGSSLTLHHPFAFEILKEQLQSKVFSYFSAPEQVVDWMLTSGLPLPQKLAIVRARKSDGNRRPGRRFRGPNFSICGTLEDLAQSQ